ncbi:NADH dehydrogenase subunit 2 (mitochondrion) [Tachypleus tridentatus]|uniref:NADH-ubiquinone oxidoreductase chain 2 n=1 Tax=Tachypleus tridentatus TaxID=6853 RepID=C1KRJ2_TACTR|nr:NADH dehydrogenase subunit 2 [Tachypleus tridentatus]ACO52912.1 NADH dehydrogenase subunit 2 [Tachypleus tridentatus]WGU45253.1 NADH dehydrogenase subunit 2 [Tachypleus tridentatus]
MMISYTNNLFFLVMLLGSFITMSSSSWFMAWIGMEINLMGFIPLISSHSNKRCSEASMKYFFIQSIASSIFLFSFLLSSSFFSIIQSISMTPWMISSIMLLSLSVKLGASPFHMWLPTVSEGLSWFNCFILMTWQKIAPLSMISLINQKSFMILMIIYMSAISGSIGGLNQTSLRKIMAFSSISHMAWILASMLFSKTLWILYLLIYSILIFSIIYNFLFLNMFHINQIFTNQNKNFNMFIITNFLSLGGLPPFFGFLPKWLIITQLIQNNMMFMISILILSTLINLYFYTRISYSSILMYNNNNKWMKMKKSVPLTHSIMSMISLFGLILMSISFSML